MKNLDEILPDVLPEMPGCPKRVAMNALVLAARRFCRDTHAWVEEIERFEATEFRTYDVFIEAGRELIAIASVRTSDRELAYRFDEAENVISLDRPPEGKVVMVDGVLQPAEGSREVPDWMATRYREGLAHGAKERLAAMRDQEWSDPKGMGRHRMLFREAIDEAKVRRSRGHSEQPLTVRPRSFV